MRLAQSIREYLPPELQAQVPSGEGMLFSGVYKMFLISAGFCISQYLQNLETATLLIEKFQIDKQQKQLNEFFQRQKNAIIVHQV